MDLTNLEIKANEERAHPLAAELQDLNKKTYEQEMLKKTQKKKSTKKQTYQNNLLVHKECKPNSIIKHEVCVTLQRSPWEDWIIEVSWVRWKIRVTTLFITRLGFMLYLD